jgi:hypothetical protein
MSPREFWDIAFKSCTDIKGFGAKVWRRLNWLSIRSGAWLFEDLNKYLGYTNGG